MEKLIQQIDAAIIRYQRFAHNRIILDLIQKMEAHKIELQGLNHNSQAG